MVYKGSRLPPVLSGSTRQTLSRFAVAKAPGRLLPGAFSVNFFVCAVLCAPSGLPFRSRPGSPCLGILRPSCRPFSAFTAAAHALYFSHVPWHAGRLPGQSGLQHHVIMPVPPVSPRQPSSRSSVPFCPLSGPLHCKGTNHARPAAGHPAFLCR